MHGVRRGDLAEGDSEDPVVPYAAAGVAVEVF
jgi:hypothetical protein